MPSRNARNDQARRPSGDPDGEDSTITPLTERPSKFDRSSGTIVALCRRRDRGAPLGREAVRDAKHLLRSIPVGGLRRLAHPVLLAARVTRVRVCLTLRIRHQSYWKNAARIGIIAAPIAVASTPMVEGAIVGTGRW